jgi:hypothetical protein
LSALRRKGGILLYYFVQKAYYRLGAEITEIAVASDRESKK